MKEVAAGGIVLDGGRVLLIRDRYGRWSFPKGRLEAAETVEEAACREVAEETGIRGEIAAALGVVAYRITREDVPLEKEVHYFLLRGGGRPRPRPEEVREAAWFSWSEAETLLRQDGYPANLRIFEKARLLAGGNY